MKKLSRFSFLLLMFCGSLQSFAGTTGSIWGTVFDRLTGKVIAGAIITVSDSRFRCLSDRNGFFFINLLPPGFYNLQVTMIGYIPEQTPDVQICADSRSRIDFFLKPDIIPSQSEPDTDVNPVYIQTEIPEADRVFSGLSLRQQLPLTGLLETLAFEPNCVRTHIKGGRSHEVLYLVDGQSTQDLLFREANLNLPFGSITDLVIYSSGFDAEYGNSLSGVVNIITQEGKNSPRLFLNLGTDNMARFRQSHNAHQIEWAANGPLLLAFGGPVLNLHYQFAGSVNLSDTPWRNEMTRVFQSPIARSYAFQTKIKYHLTPNLSLTGQGIFQNDSGHEYADLWQHNLAGLPGFRKKNHRYQVTLAHELSPKCFYTLAFLQYEIQHEVPGAKSNDYVALSRESASVDAMILSGHSQWWRSSQQNGLAVKADLIRQLKLDSELKYGIEFNRMNVGFDQSNFTEVPVLGDMTQIGYLADQTHFRHHPYTLGTYFQTRFTYSDINSTLGLRVDAFDAAVKSSGVHFQTADASFNLAPRNSRFQSRISPRAKVGINLTAKDRLRLNYGWFYQLPPLYYFYQNLDIPLRGTYTLFGNPELSFEKTILYELSYARQITHKIELQTSIFQKDVTHLTGTQVTRLPVTAMAAPEMPLAWAEYRNNGHGTISGLEINLNFQPSPNYSADFGYSLQNATGTASRAEENLYRLIWGANEISDEISLDWDQRHTFIINLNLMHPEKWGVYFWGRIGSPLPAVLLEAASTDRTRFHRWSSNFALKAYFSISSGYGRLSPYLQINNLFNTQSYIGFDTHPFPASQGLNDPTLYEPSRHLLFGMQYHFN